MTGAACSRGVPGGVDGAGQRGVGGLPDRCDPVSELSRTEVFARVLATIEAVHAADDPDVGLAAAREVLADLDVAGIRRVAAALALVAARAGRRDVAEWLERQRLELVWWTS